MGSRWTTTSGANAFEAAGLELSLSLRGVILNGLREQRRAPDQARLHVEVCALYHKRSSGATGVRQVRISVVRAPGGWFVCMWAFVGSRFIFRTIGR